METGKYTLKKPSSGLHGWLRLVAAAACLWPAIAAAQTQTWNPTFSDSRFNTAAGSEALPTHTSRGLENTAVGFEALSANTTGSYNTATGVAALANNTNGGYNTATGLQAL